MTWFLRAIALSFCLLVGLSVSSCGSEDDDGGDDNGPMATGGGCPCAACYCIGLDCPDTPACCDLECPPSDGGVMDSGPAMDTPDNVRPGRPGMLTIDCNMGRSSENEAQCLNRCNAHCEDGPDRRACREGCCTSHSEYADCAACCSQHLSGPGLGSQRGCVNLCNTQMRER
jgi:hypothetical protein